jgi:DNA-directed RNA polymerase subunit RPC12/RpoP
MKTFSYRCPRCGPFDVADEATDTIQCRCGNTAKRMYQLNVIGSTLKHQGRFDHVVGAYVENEGQFMSLLHKGQDEQAKKLNMDVKLATVDSRDTEGLAELHGQPVAERKELLDQSKSAWAKQGGPT